MRSYPITERLIPYYNCDRPKYLYLIEHYVRQPNNQWLLEEFDQFNAALTIGAIGCTLSMEDIYEKSL